MKNINSKLIYELGKHEVDVNISLCFIFAAIYLGQDGIAELINRGMLTEDEEVYLRINFLNKSFDEENNIIYEPRIPLFGSEGIVYQQFTEGLVQKGMNSLGHPDNPQQYGVIEFNEKTAEAFAFVQDKIKDLDVQKLIKCVLTYYRVAEPAKKLENYLLNHAVLDYKTFKDEQRNLLR